tara:strand:+ start:6129 stop:6944 length:816 start_codon:yes stop_codon:yes gene_type:complete
MLEVYIIAYNNIFCVEYQIKTFKAFCKDKHKLIVIDSNCGEHVANTETKKVLCEKEGVEFLSLPNNLSNPGGGQSDILGHKLNYVYNNMVKQRNPKYFAFIDQDFFPFADFSVKEQLDEHGMYGDVMLNSKHNGPRESSPWVIHPWLSFYRTDFLEGYNMDWMPILPVFDTGGRNWDNFISKKGLSLEPYWIRDTIICYFPWQAHSDAGPPNDRDKYFNWNGRQIYGQTQIYDNKFIHMLNSKFLDDPFNPKTNWCKGFLDAALLKSNLTL